MSAKTLEDVRNTIEAEGFDYAFRFYSDFEEVEDEEFHRLRLAYKEAANALDDYLPEPEEDEEPEPWPDEHSIADRSERRSDEALRSDGSERGRR